MTSQADVVGLLMQQLGASGSTGSAAEEQAAAVQAAAAAVAGSPGAQGDQSPGSSEEVWARTSLETEAGKLRDALTLLLSLGRQPRGSSPLPSGCAALWEDEIGANASTADSASDTDGGVAPRPCQVVPPPVLDDVGDGCRGVTIVSNVSNLRQP